MESSVVLCSICVSSSLSWETLREVASAVSGKHPPGRLRSPALNPRRRALSLGGEHGGKRHFAINGLFEDVLDRRANFRAVAIDDPALLTFYERPTRHHFEQHAIFR